MDEYRNQVELMRQALLFYGNVENYTKELKQDLTPVDIDNGSQARFALETLETVEKLKKDMEEEYLDTIKQSLEDQPNQQSMLNLIEAIKKSK